MDTTASQSEKARGTGWLEGHAVGRVWASIPFVSNGREGGVQTLRSARQLAPTSWSLSPLPFSSWAWPAAKAAPVCNEGCPKHTCLLRVCVGGSYQPHWGVLVSGWPRPPTDSPPSHHWSALLAARNHSLSEKTERQAVQPGARAYRLGCMVGSHTCQFLSDRLAQLAGGLGKAEQPGLAQPGVFQQNSRS